MNKTDYDGGPIAPILNRTLATGEHITEHFGMTLRDWFAGQALMGLMVNYASHSMDLDLCVTGAQQAADAMIAARKESQP